MLCTFEKPVAEVRFGTEKSIGFPRLTAIFAKAVTRDSFLRSGRSGWGACPRILFGLARC